MRIIKSEKQMHAYAAALARTLKGGEVFALVGDLGAGKTTFVKGMAKALGVTAVVQSPTFLLLKCYPLKRPTTKYKLQTLCHVDAYRIKSGRELITIGLGELMKDPHTVTVIEWADRVKKIIPPRARWLRFEHRAKQNERNITINYALRTTH